MKLKTYVARDPQEALAQVKKELGPEAVILSAQSRRPLTPGTNFPRRRGVEVTAAADHTVTLDAFAGFQPWHPEPINSRLPSFHLKEELEEMKALLKQWLGAQGPPSWLAPYQDLTRLFHDLVKAGIHNQIICRWLETVRTSLSNGNRQSSQNLKELSLRQLMQEVEIVDPWKDSVRGPHIWTFLGSTGVGKTTTIAKLAIQAAFVKKTRVGLISLDNVRLGGQDQLAAYARISGLPLVTAQTREELAESLHNMFNLDVILIDTPGRNPFDSGLHLDLRQLFGELKGLKHHLVVSATTAEDNIAEAFHGFNVLNLASCIVTKVDESRDIVGVFNQLYKRRMALSYLATGQKVPEDLELADYRRLSGLLFKPHQSQMLQREAG
jgi:flagellar biosynthesis protein FlhF|uniref:Flagellar biosynthesis protein FlhF n=1 Tax=Desulfobacca acetoxidans TaxID=60893 RepID=A0A7V6A1M2_9BACT